MRKTHDYEYHYENEGVAGSCRIRIYEDGDRPIIVATQQREPQGPHRGSVLNAANIIAAHFIENGPLSEFHLSRELREESVRRQTLELIANAAPFVFVEEYLEPEHKLNFLWFDSYEIIGLVLGGKVQKQIGNPYRQPTSSEEVEALIGAYSFVCQADERFRSACEGLPFYAEHEGKPYCVLHYPGFNEKVYPFDDVINKKLQEGDFNFRGVWFPYARSFDADNDFKGPVDFSYATFNGVPDDDYQPTPHFTGDRFHSDVSFHQTKFCTGAVFSGVSFRGHVDFSEATFEEQADFAKVRFYKEADFSKADFVGEALFDEARFREGVKLEDTKFQDDAYFYDTVFHGDANDSVLDFSRTSFNQAADFSGVRFYAKKYVAFSHGDGEEDPKATFSGRADFGGATFRGDAYFTDIEFPEEAEFSGATFHGEAGFWDVAFRQNTDFYDTRFWRPAHFHETEFDGETNFIEAQFAEGNSGGFAEAKFADFVDFRHTRFGNVTFHLASFEEAWFWEAYFKTAEFREAKFNQDADFRSATFEVANFSEAVFSKDANFVGTTFQKGAKFSEAILTGRGRFFGTDTNRIFNSETLVDFQDARIHEPEQLTFHTVLLRPNWFVNTDARNFTFTNVSWYGLPGGPESSLEDEIRPLQARSVESTHRLLAKTCRELYANYEEKRDYPLASEFHYWSMDALRREGIRRFGFIRTLYWLMSGYGERPGQAFWVLVLIWAAFTGLYWLCGPESLRITPNFLHSAEHFWESAAHLWQAAVYSLSALARLNPNPRPDGGVFQLLVTLEGLLGPLQIALFALAVRRKVMR
jgi:uncharacterized protein YjbI with pentapeptide repeats